MVYLMENNIENLEKVCRVLKKEGTEVKFAATIGLLCLVKPAKVPTLTRYMNMETFVKQVNKWTIRT